MDFGNILTAMVTPFDQDGNINSEKTKELIDHLIANGTDTLVVAGTTGESPTLSKKEKLDLFQLCVEYVNKRVPIIAGTGSNNTAESVELTKEATELGVDGIMLVTPYYNKPSQEGMFQHFKTIAEATSLPVMLYNVPSRTGVKLDAETIIALAKIPTITSVKEASGDLDQMAMIISETDPDFSVYSGDDSLTLPAMSIGAKGVVSVASHVIGSELQEIASTFINGRTAQAAAIHRSLLPTMKAMFIAPNPTCVKYALQLKGIDVGGVRLPLVPLTILEQSLVKENLIIKKEDDK